MTGGAAPVVAPPAHRQARSRGARRRARCLGRRAGDGRARHPARRHRGGRAADRRPRRPRDGAGRHLERCGADRGRACARALPGRPRARRSGRRARSRCAQRPCRVADAGTGSWTTASRHRLLRLRGLGLRDAAPVSPRPGSPMPGSIPVRGATGWHATSRLRRSRIDDPAARCTRSPPKGDGAASQVEGTVVRAAPSRPKHSMIRGTLVGRLLARPARRRHGGGPLESALHLCAPLLGISHPRGSARESAGPRAGSHRATARATAAAAPSATRSWPAAGLSRAPGTAKRSTRSGVNA